MERVSLLISQIKNGDTHGAVKVAVDFRYGGCELLPEDLLLFWRSGLG
jgi:hypothetical protein